MKTIKIITKGKRGETPGPNIPRSIDTGDYSLDLQPNGTLKGIIFHDRFVQIGEPQIVPINLDVQEVYVLNENGKTIHKLS